MRVHKFIVLLALAALFVLSTAANDDVIKIGIVDIDQAVSSSDEGKAAREELARKQREAEAKIQPLLDRYKALEEEIKAKKFVLSDEALFQRQLDLVEMRNQIEAKAGEVQKQMQVDQKRLEAPLVAKLQKIIQDVGKSQGYTMIMTRNAPGVVYAREALDITDLVIERYNKKS
jgi:outer membrane protein